MFVYFYYNSHIESRSVPRQEINLSFSFAMDVFSPLFSPSLFASLEMTRGTDKIERHIVARIDWRYDLRCWTSCDTSCYSLFGVERDTKMRLSFLKPKMYFSISPFKLNDDCCENYVGRITFFQVFETWIGVDMDVVLLLYTFLHVFSVLLWVIVVVLLIEINFLVVKIWLDLNE